MLCREARATRASARNLAFEWALTSDESTARQAQTSTGQQEQEEGLVWGWHYRKLIEALGPKEFLRSLQRSTSS